MWQIVSKWELITIIQSSVIGLQWNTWKTLRFRGCSLPWNWLCSTLLAYVSKKRANTELRLKYFLMFVNQYFISQCFNAELDLILSRLSFPQMYQTSYLLSFFRSKIVEQFESPDLCILSSAYVSITTFCFPVLFLYTILHRIYSLTEIHTRTHIAFLLQATASNQILALTGLDLSRGFPCAEIGNENCLLYQRHEYGKHRYIDSRSDMLYHIRSQQMISSNHRSK